MPLDPFSVRIDEFLKTRGLQAVRSAFSDFHQLGLRMDDDPSVIRSDMALVQAALISLVSPHPWVKLLMTFRRLPLNMLQERDAAPHSIGDSIGSGPVIKLCDAVRH